MGFPRGTSGKEPACQFGRHKRRRFDPWVRKIPWRKAWQPTPLVSYSQQGHRESDMTEAAWHTHRPQNKENHQGYTKTLYNENGWICQ